MTLRRKTSPDPGADAMEAAKKEEAARPISFFRVYVTNIYTQAVTTTVIPFNETKTIENIIDTVTNKNPVEDRAAYGLWVETPDVPAGEFLAEDRTATSYSLQGEIVAHFKMKPWKLFVHPPPDQPDLQEPLEREFLPGSNCSHIIQQVVKAFGDSLVKDQEYGLFLTPLDDGKVHKKDPESEWLMDSKSLATYKLNKRNVRITLRTQPKTTTVRFPDGTTESYPIKLSLTLQTFLDDILPKKNLTSPSDYGIKILANATTQDSSSPASSSTTETTTSEGVGATKANYLKITSTDPCYSETRSLASIGIEGDTVLDVIPRPKPITLTLPSGEKHTLLVPFILPVSELEQLICENLTIPQNEYVLRMFVSEDESQRLIPWNSLREQKVPENSIMMMVKKSTDDIPLSESDVNLWEEADEGHITYDENHQLVSASLNKLVQNLTSETNHDPSFMRTVFLTYRSFTTPEMLFKKLVERFHVPDKYPAETRDLIRMRVYTALKHWLEQQGEDLGSVFDRIASFIEDPNLHNESPKLASLVTRLKSEIASRSARKEVARYKFATAPPPAKIPKSLTPTTTIFDIDELEIARQLTLPLFDILNAIRPEELFNNAWSKANKEKRAPHILQFIDQFNFYAAWVSSLIVQEPKLAKRAKVFDKLVMIAVKLRELNNFHLLTAFISGFNNSAINRLKFSRAKLPKKSQQVLRELEILTNMEGSFKNYRLALKSTAPPCVPYIGVQLMDLTFIEDGNPDMLEGLINWSKRVLVYEIFQSIQKYQTQGYNIAVVKELQDWLKNQPVLDEKELYSQSLLREPRGCEKGDLI